LAILASACVEQRALRDLWLSATGAVRKTAGGGSSQTDQHSLIKMVAARFWNVSFSISGILHFLQHTISCGIVVAPNPLFG
jgi:hypothetical protein